MEKVPLRVSHQIIPNISQQYSSVPHRVIMEFIDNSLDAAEEFFDSTSNAYTKPINIQIRINSISNDPSIEIEDNCTGILDVGRLVHEIGNSSKKNNVWTNGQFGFGIYSFMAIAEKLCIYTKTDNMSGKQLCLLRSMFDQDEAPSIEIDHYPAAAVGTLVRLTGFREGLFSDITAESIKKDVATHFEKLLERKNLNVTIKNNQKIETLEPFDYSQYPGVEIHEEIKVLELDKKGTVKRLDLMGKMPIQIYLKVTKGILVDRPPVFIAKGRRINSVKDISTFKSFNKSKIWGHQNVTGYIDVGDILEPQLDRKDFVHNKEAKAVYRALTQLEPKLLEEINKITQETDVRNFKLLESRLNNILSKLAREDAVRQREEFGAGKDTDLGGGGIPEGITEDTLGGKDYGEGDGSRGAGGGVGKNEDGNGVGTLEKPDGALPGAPGGEGPLDGQPLDFDTGFKGSPKKRSGLNIEIVSGEPQENLDGTKERSTCVEGTIRIYKEHEDFMARVEKSRQGETKITPKLISYLAGEITVWYEDILCNKRQQKEYNVTMFKNVMSFFYRFEDMLSDLNGKLLSSLQDDGEGNNE